MLTQRILVCGILVCASAVLLEGTVYRHPSIGRTAERLKIAQAKHLRNKVSDSKSGSAVSLKCPRESALCPSRPVARICIYIYIYIYIHTHTYTCVYIYIYIHTYRCTLAFDAEYLRCDCRMSKSAGPGPRSIILDHIIL